MVKRASRTSDLSRLRMLARVARDYRETERLIRASRKQGVACRDLELRLWNLGEELDKHVQNAFIATQAVTPDAFAGLPD